ncbi:glutamate receptor 1-like [Babylonia areolata]|uniref:glutamate receptor 1-like n=1 Tax=Babylonia areolata TaxID=304850 RepID=UPI003FD13FE6
MTTPGLPHFTVTTLEEEPFISRELNKEGGARYVGFMKDLMDSLAKKVGFTYDFRVVADGKYGSQTAMGWNGMIGELVDGTAEIAAGSLTVTAAREEAVDFTKPFMSTAVNLLVKKPERMDLGLGYLVRPFSTDFWVLLLIAIVIVGFLFFLIGRFSPYEWVKVPGDRDQRGARNAFSLRNSYLFVLSSLTWQGFREPPRSLSGRFLAAFWWIFILFTIVAYTANLTAYLLARPEQIPVMPFKTYEELLEANEIKVGAPAFGATQAALHKSRDPTLHSLWVKISQDNSWVSSNQAGLDLIQSSKGTFVMFMESSTAEYLARKNCDVMLYGKNIFHRSLALATQKGHVITSLLDKGLEEMRASGELNMMQERWWRFAGECSHIDGRQYSQKGDSLSSLPIYPVTLRDMAVAILILFLGFIVAVVGLIIEIIYHTIATKGKLEKPKVLDSKIFKAPKFTKGKSSKAAAAPSDPEAGVSEPLSGEALGEGTSGEGASGEGAQEATEA